jgi:DNA invertase Pin-like site-specific DNA recombinase
MKKIGYARVSTTGQKLDRQISVLRSEDCDSIFREKASAKSIKGRPELERAIDALGVSDVLVIAEWDRATRSMMDGISIIQQVAYRDATVKVIDKPWFDLTTPMGNGILAFLSALAEDERERIVRRANAGRTAAKAAGVKFGRKPKLTEHRRTLAITRKQAGETDAAIAKDMGVSRSTISRL